MVEVEGDVVSPTALIIPKITEVTRDLLKAEEGTLIYNLDSNKLNICDVERTVGASSWSIVSSD